VLRSQTGALFAPLRSIRAGVGTSRTSSSQSQPSSCAMGVRPTSNARTPHLAAAVSVLGQRGQFASTRDRICNDEASRRVRAITRTDVARHKAPSLGLADWLSHHSGPRARQVDGLAVSSVLPGLARLRDRTDLLRTCDPCCFTSEGRPSHYSIASELPHHAFMAATVHRCAGTVGSALSNALVLSYPCARPTDTKVSTTPSSDLPPSRV
jgi:hypothetical protein